MRMRPSADHRAPGIYQTTDSVAIPPMTIADTRVAGFVGLAVKGPVNEPVRIASWDEYLEVYGYSDRHYLSDTVFAFFRNGGTGCWVVRVAHMPAAGEAATAEHAACAEHVQVDDWGKPSLRIHALNEGEWGNNIWFKCVHQAGAQALLTRDLEVGAGEAYVSSTRGFEVGALVRIYDRENSDYVVLTAIADKLVRWSSETPVNRRHKAAAPTYVEVLDFEIHVALRERREVFKGLQMHPSSRHYAPRVLGARSRLIRVADLFTRSPVPHNLPEPMPLTRLTGGRDGVEAITPDDFLGVDHGPGQRSGLAALAEFPEVTQLAIPDAMEFYRREPGPAGEVKAQRVQDQLIIAAELSRERFAIIDIPESKDVEWVRRWRRRTDTSYAAFYWPWLKMVGPEGKVRSLPPSGVMAAVFAQRDNEGVHVAPANVPIVGAEDVSLRVTEDHLGLLNSDSVNSFRLQRGVRPWGVRTSSSDPQWRYITTRRLFIMIRRSLEAGYAWVSFEPNDRNTWDFVENRTRTFLADLYKRGMLVGGNPEDAFFVKCDAETNPTDNIDSGILTCEIGVAPVSPTEFIMLSLAQRMSGASST
jgi:phage tail sheath protein FI